VLSGSLMAAPVAGLAGALIAFLASRVRKQDRIGFREYVGAD
jgi:hypothetical protein